MSLGIVIDNLSLSQESFFTIGYINKLVEKGIDCTIFVNEFSTPCMKVNCAVMNISEIWSFSGLLIAFNLNNAQIISKVISNVKTLFYVSDLEWLRGKNNFVNNIKIYNSVDFLCVRSLSHYKAIHNYCNIVPNLIKDYNIEEAYEHYSRI